jgi:plasmid stability protein
VAAITIRRLSEQTKERLRVRAAAHGRSMESEARHILDEALSRPLRADLNWAQQLVELTRDAGGDPLPIPERTDQARAAQFE